MGCFITSGRGLALQSGPLRAVLLQAVLVQIVVQIVALQSGGLSPLLDYRPCHLKLSANDLIFRLYADVDSK